jgi:hypothetical protein
MFQQKQLIVVPTGNVSLTNGCSPQPTATPRSHRRPKTMFQKIAATLATVLIAAAVTLPTTANAGCGGGHKGFFKSSSSYSMTKKRRARAAALKRAKARKLAALKAKKKAKARKIAALKAKKKARKLAALKAKKQAKAIALAKTESTFVEATSNSAILTKTDSSNTQSGSVQKVAALESANSAEVLENADTGCKRYIPAIGKAVTIACE